MKKSILFASSCALLFFACSSNKISDEAVKKYETQMNEAVKVAQQTYKEMGAELTMPNFTCQADEGFIKCQNQGFTYYEVNGLDENKKMKILEAKSIIFRSNDIYTGENKGLISSKEYVDSLFENTEKIESQIQVDGIKISDEMVATAMEFAVLFQDEKMKAMLETLLKDEYKFQVNGFGLKNQANIDGKVNYELVSAKNPTRLTFNTNLVVKDMVFPYIDEKLKWKFDTNKLAMDQNSLSTLNAMDPSNPASMELLFALGDFVNLKDLNLNLSLDTKDAFKPYLEMAKGYLSLMKNQSQDEKQALLFDKATLLLDELGKNPVYKLDTLVEFKDIALNKLNSQAVKTLKINNQDFSEILVLLENLGMMSE